jgi:dipeptidyl aminopeptidase/acylaminoacyl peptidase
VFRFRLLSDPQLSPDGRRVVYASQRTDREQNRYFSNLWLVDVESGRDRPFTAGDHREGSPRWSPDSGRIVFISNRDETAQLWCIPADGGEATPLTHLEEGSLGAVEWSPDGTHLVFTYRPTPPAARKTAREEREKAHRSTPPQVIRHLHYREEGAGFIGDERWQVYVLHVDTGAVRQVTHGAADAGHPAWSPDSARLAYVTNAGPEPELAPQLDEIRFLTLDDGSETTLDAPAGPKHQLAWSPDGALLAYFGNTDVADTWSAADSHLWVVSVTGGDARDLAADLDRPVGDQTLADLRSFGGGCPGPVWAPDSKSLYTLVSDRGAVHAYQWFPDGSAPVNLTPGFAGEIASLSLDAAGEQFAVIAGDPVQPGDVHLLRLTAATPELRPLTAANAALLAELELAVPEEVIATCDGGEVHGWLLRPTASPDQAVPLLLYIHGGPHTQYGWAMMHEFQFLAARGYAELYANPRGSRGYGEAHVAAIRGDWGGPDYRDLMAITEHAATLPGLDPGRVGVTGGSYGGYMTNWIVGHTHRFRCGITQRSVVNLHSMGGTCDFNFSDSPYFGGNTWSAPERMLAQSPLSHAGNVRTPLLIIHSEGDLRCPIEQAEQLFAALKRQRCEVELVRYPREANHGLSRGGPPDLRLDRLERILAWLDRWLLPK